MMRVLHLITNPNLTHGGPVFEFEVSKRLKDSGIYFDYLITEPVLDEDEKRYRSQGSEMFLLPWDKKHGLIVREIKVNRAYYKFFKEHPYKIVYADTENALRAIHLLMARLAGVPVRVIHSHNTGMQTNSRLSHLISRWMRNLFPLSATHYFACSDAAAQWLFPKSICRKKKYTMLKNGVDLNRFRFNAQNRSEIRAQFGLKEELVLGHVGRFMPQKNHAKLVEIFAAVCERQPEARLMLIGEGPLQDDIRTMVQEKGLQDRVIFVGNVPDVSPYLHAMDVFVMPSLFEGLPVTGVEAQAAGLPCVFSDSITPELKITNAAHFLPLNAENSTWAERICALAAANRPNTEEQIIRAGFSIQNTADILYNFYSKYNGE